MGGKPEGGYCWSAFPGLRAKGTAVHPGLHPHRPSAQEFTSSAMPLACLLWGTFGDLGKALKMELFSPLQTSAGTPDPTVDGKMALNTFSLPTFKGLREIYFKSSFFVCFGHYLWNQMSERCLSCIHIATTLKQQQQAPSELPLLRPPPSVLSMFQYSALCLWKAVPHPLKAGGTL